MHWGLWGGVRGCVYWDDYMCVHVCGMCGRGCDVCVGVYGLWIVCVQGRPDQALETRVGGVGGWQESVSV